MKITDIRAVQPRTPDAPQDWRTSLGQILVAVDTDKGLTGYGVGGGGMAGIHVVRTVLRDRLLGKDPEQIDAHFRGMYAATLPFGRKGLAIMAISGVDLALWDLRGRVAGQPVAELLGGRIDRQMPTYSTFWDTIDRQAAGTQAAFKLHVGRHDYRHPATEILATVAAARQVIGPDSRLMVDAWMKWDVPLTLELAPALQELNVEWIEEPLSPDDLDGYARLRDECPVPIAGGEHEFTAAAFETLIDGRLHRVLQPDVCWCGGLTELIKIYQCVESAPDGLRVCPHRGAEIWALHAMAALDPQPLAESGRPWMTWVRGQPPIVDGTIQLTDAPGFGIEIHEDEIFAR